MSFSESRSLELDFRKLAGHTDCLNTLKKGGRKQPFPSVIFSGPSQVGKRLTAVWYAAFLNCHSKDELAPCGECSSCKKTLSGQHPDLVFTRVPEKKTVMGVGEVREAIHQIQYAPFEGQYRIWVLEDGERLTDEAQNALLKTLEEPPKSAVILLVTHLFGGLIPTVVSRCRLLRFQGLEQNLMQETLQSRGLEPEMARRLSRLSGGALGACLEYSQDSELFASREQAVDLFLSLPGCDLWGAIEAAQRFEKLPLGGPRAVLDIGVSLYRDLLVLSAGCSELVSHEHQMERLKDLAAKLSISRIREFLDVLDQASQHLRSHVSPRLLFQRLCTNLAKVD